MIERLAQFIQNQGLSVRAFELSIAASDGMIRRAINNKSDIQSKWIALIAENYPNINLDWLILGRGPMLRDNKIPEESKLRDTPNVTPILPVEESIIYKMYEKKDEENKALIRENGRLVERIRSLQSQLDQYCPPPQEVESKGHPKGLGLSETVTSVSTKPHSLISDHSADSANCQRQNQ